MICLENEFRCICSTLIFDDDQRKPSKMKDEILIIQKEEVKIYERGKYTLAMAD